MAKISEIVDQLNKENSFWVDEENYHKHFEKAYEVKLFNTSEPYMYMGEDFDFVYFKHKVTREYKNLSKKWLANYSLFKQWVDR